jgi:hypothetical protein
MSYAISQEESSSVVPEEVKAQPWYIGPYLFSGPQRLCPQHNPTETSKQLGRLYMDLLECHLSQEEKQELRKASHLKTHFTNELHHVPDIAVQLSHSQDRTYGLRVLSFTKLDRYRDRTTTGYSKPVEVDQFPQAYHLLVEGFQMLSMSLGLEVTLHTKPEAYIAMAKASSGKGLNYPVVVELVFSKGSQVVFRQ